MKNKIIFFALIILNMVLLYKFYATKISHKKKILTQNSIHISDSGNEIIRIDSLIIKKWNNDYSSYTKYNLPAVFCFFSKFSCQSCIESIIKFIKKYNTREINFYMTSVDIVDFKNIEPLLIKFSNDIDFYKVEFVKFSKPDFEPVLPFIAVVDKNKNIVLKKNVLPLEPIEKDKQFTGLLTLILDNN